MNQDIAPFESYDFESLSEFWRYSWQDRLLPSLVAGPWGKCVAFDGSNLGQHITGTVYVNLSRHNKENIN